VAYYYLPLPEASDEELEEAVQSSDLLHLTEFKGVKVIYITLIFGALSQFCYVGGQESISTTFPGYLRRALKLNVDTTQWLAIAHSTFAGGRFFAAFLSFFIKPRLLLLFFYTGALVFSILCMNLKGGAGKEILLVLYFFEGPIFSLIFAICLRNLGRRVKEGSALLTGAISGGAVFPPIMIAFADGQALRYQDGYRVVVAAFSFGMLFPLYLNAVPLLRQLADPVKRSRNTAESGDLDDETRRPSDGSGRRSSIGLEILTGPKSPVDSSPPRHVEVRREVA
jgi:fucose permease